MDLIYLSESFYRRYSNCTEILRKPTRPYACLSIEIDGVLYAIPFRHHISHQYAFITYGEAGLDFTKAVVIESENDIGKGRPQIEDAEWRKLKGNSDKIFFEFRKFVRKYKRALKKNDGRSATLLRYCALQYFDLEEK